MEWNSIARLSWQIAAAHLWQCTLVLIVIALLAIALRRAPAWTRHALWVAALVKLLLPFPLLGRFGSSLVGHFLPAGQESVWFLSFVEIVTVGPVSVPAAGSRGGNGFLAAPIFDPFIALSLAWLAVAGWLVVRWIRRASIARYLSERSVAVDPRLRLRLDAALARAGIARDRVRLTTHDTAPAVHGLLRPTILLSAGLVDRLTTDELQTLLLHEEAHRRRRDPVVGLLARIAVVFFFFYPPLWYVLRRLEAAGEISCDEWVLDHDVQPETYLSALRQTVRLHLVPVTPIAATGGGSPSLLQRRIRRLRARGGIRSCAVTTWPCLPASFSSS